MILSLWLSLPALPPPHQREGQMAGGGSGCGGAGLPLTPHGASPHSMPASVLLYLTVATVSRKEKRGGKVNFPPPTQIFLAGVVFTLPSRGGRSWQERSNSNLPPKEGGLPTQLGGLGRPRVGPSPGTLTLLGSLGPRQGVRTQNNHGSHHLLSICWCSARALT